MKICYQTALTENKNYPSLQSYICECSTDYWKHCFLDPTLYRKLYELWRVWNNASLSSSDHCEWLELLFIFSYHKYIQLNENVPLFPCLWYLFNQYWLHTCCVLVSGRPTIVTLGTKRFYQWHACMVQRVLYQHQDFFFHFTCHYFEINCPLQTCYCQIYWVKYCNRLKR